MDTRAYFASLEEIVTDPVLLTGSAERLNEEVRQNAWRIELPAELAASLRVADFAHWLQRVKQNRLAQLRRQAVTDALLYYLWVDYQSGHLRFNFLSNCHEQLPFSAPVELVRSEAALLADFLRFTARADYAEPETEWRVRVYCEIMRA
ncbi:hypothetical protein LJ737_24605 [Hymenobacter sp. 15J16-1T3B]|uniref:hypothetical protein n=1 Tax=Hymenobacter sp. 15J16-1T3B TaxID=2886941 RepID=UPI001D0F9C1B|nr:hypothetical protein [Hymenobacter sp. 15J16-1T3B]MCC3160441.1 hypothetical protein [Hymenobacter sp. 15J16-1T3B]